MDNLTFIIIGIVVFALIIWFLVAMKKKGGPTLPQKPAGPTTPTAPPSEPPVPPTPPETPGS